MHALLRLAAVATLVFATNAALAQDQNAQAGKAVGEKAAASAQSSGHQHQAGVRRHNGRWWYQNAQNNWLVWQNNAWVPYTPGMFAGNAQVATRQPARRYSYDPVQSNYYPRVYSAPRAYGANRSIRYAGSKINADYAPYTGGSMQ